MWIEIKSKKTPFCSRCLSHIYVIMSSYFFFIYQLLFFFNLILYIIQEVGVVVTYRKATIDSIYNEQYNSYSSIIVSNPERRYHYWDNHTSIMKSSFFYSKKKKVALYEKVCIEPFKKRFHFSMHDHGVTSFVRVGDVEVLLFFFSAVCQTHSLPLCLKVLRLHQGGGSRLVLESDGSLHDYK